MMEVVKIHSSWEIYFKPKFYSPSHYIKFCALRAISYALNIYVREEDDKKMTTM